MPESASTVIPAQMLHLLDFGEIYPVECYLGNLHALLHIECPIRIVSDYHMHLTLIAGVNLACQYIAIEQTILHLLPV